MDILQKYKEVGMKAEIEYLELDENIEWNNLINKVLEKCFEVEKMDDFKLYISVTLTNPENIEILIKKQMCFHFLCLKKMRYKLLKNYNMKKHLEIL